MALLIAADRSEQALGAVRSAWLDSAFAFRTGW